jgi:hypothetical protein
MAFLHQTFHKNGLTSTGRFAARGQRRQAGPKSLNFRPMQRVHTVNHATHCARSPGDRPRDGSAARVLMRKTASCLGSKGGG